MRTRKKVGWFILLLLPLGCWERQEAGKWPAHVAGIEGFSDAEKGEIEEALDYQNATAGRDILTTREDPHAFQITIRRVETPAHKPTRQGRALLNGSEGCVIEITTRSFSGAEKGLIKPLLAHEIGHCAGLNHAPDTASIMYYTTRPLLAYTPSAIADFFHMLLARINPEP